MPRNTELALERNWPINIRKDEAIFLHRNTTNSAIDNYYEECVYNIPPVFYI